MHLGIYFQFHAAISRSGPSFVVVHQPRIQRDLLPQGSAALTQSPYNLPAVAFFDKMKLASFWFRAGGVRVGTAKWRVQPSATGSWQTISPCPSDTAAGPGSSSHSPALPGHGKASLKDLVLFNSNRTLGNLLKIFIRNRKFHLWSLINP